MSIAENVRSAIRMFEVNDKKAALSHIFPALDATAKKKYPREKKVGKRVRDLLDDNQGLITRGMFMGSASLTGKIKTEIDGREYQRLADVIYKFMRNAIIHDAGLDKIELVPDPVIGLTDKGLRMGENVVWGLLLSVIGESVNSTEMITGDQAAITFNDKRININILWGKKGEIEKLVSSS